MQNSNGAFVFSYICIRDPISIPIASVDSHFSSTVHEIRKIHGGDGEPLAPSGTRDLILHELKIDSAFFS
jgi:hypothetical protein